MPKSKRQKWLLGIKEIRLGMSNNDILTLAVTPVLCGIRPAYLIDNLVLPRADLVDLIKSLQRVTARLES